MKVAVLIDGAFFIKRVRTLNLCSDLYNATQFADLAFHFSICHLQENNKKHDLYRIFFYDCSPFDKKMHNPISGKSVDFSKSKEAIFRHELHNQLKRKRKLALRLGKLSD
ncbi:MAG: NYN domain-containing protein, partial [Neisseriaceae bacterium]|nr:NYN domain-containing protein [Neisseriaceae bacterium]